MSKLRVKPSTEGYRLRVNGLAPPAPQYEIWSVYKTPANYLWSSNEQSIYLDRNCTGHQYNGYVSLNESFEFISLHLADGTLANVKTSEVFMDNSIQSTSDYDGHYVKLNKKPYTNSITFAYALVKPYNGMLLYPKLYRSKNQQDGNYTLSAGASETLALRGGYYTVNCPSKYSLSLLKIWNAEGIELSTEGLSVTNANGRTPTITNNSGSAISFNKCLLYATDTTA